MITKMQVKDKNMKFLKKYLPELYTFVNKYDVDRNGYKVDYAKKENVPFIEKRISDHWQPLHSKYSPRQEALNLVNRYNVDGSIAGIIVVGMGFGYHLQELAQRFPKTKFYIIEPDPQVFLHAVESIEIEKLPWKQLGTFILGNGDAAYRDFAESFIDKMNDQWPIMVLPSYEVANPDLLIKLTDYLSRYRNRHKQVMVTTLGYERLWHVNALINLTFVEETNSIFSLQDLIKDKPVILVGAGPSLDDSISFIKQVWEQKKAYIFAVGSGLKVLLANGIKPDAFFSHDPTEANFNNLKPVLKQNIPLFFATSTNFNILQEHVGDKYHFFTVRDNVSKYYFNDQVQETLDDSATIANVALQAMLKMKPSHLFLAGVDLAIRDNRLYAKGKEETEGTPLNTQGEGYHTTTNNLEQLVYTNKSFEGMLSEITFTLSQYKANNVFNLSGTGAKIAGAPYLSTEQAVDLFSSINEQILSMDTSTPKTVSYEKLCMFLEKVNQDFKNNSEMLKELQEQISSQGESRTIWNIIEQFNKLQEKETCQYIINPMMEGRLSKFKRFLHNESINNSPSTEFIEEVMKSIQEMDFLLETLSEVVEHILVSKKNS